MKSRPNEEAGVCEEDVKRFERRCEEVVRRLFEGCEEVVRRL